MFITFDIWQTLFDQTVFKSMNIHFCFCRTVLDNNNNNNSDKYCGNSSTIRFEIFIFFVLNKQSYV